MIDHSTRPRHAHSPIADPPVDHRRACICRGQPLAHTDAAALRWLVIKAGERGVNIDDPRVRHALRENGWTRPRLERAANILLIEGKAAAWTYRSQRVVYDITQIGEGAKAS